MQAQSLAGGEGGTATHSSILAWRIPWTENLVGHSPWCCKELDMTDLACMHILTLLAGSQVDQECPLIKLITHKE